MFLEETYAKHQLCVQAYKQIFIELPEMILVSKKLVRHLT